MVKKLLIVDDQKDIVLILEREFCRRENFQVSSAFSLEEALEILHEKPIDFVISDVRLGANSGFALAKTLRDGHPEIGVILMSAYRSAANRQQAESLGVYLFIEKPFNLAKLVADVEAFFTRPVQTASKGSGSSDEGLMNHFRAQDLVQLFCLNGRAIALEVSSDAHNQVGHIYIQRGQVQHAHFGDLSGDAAFYAIMQLPGARLMVKDWDQPVQQTITSGWEHLLIYSAIESDEVSGNPRIIPLSQAG